MYMYNVVLFPHRLLQWNIVLERVEHGVHFERHQRKRVKQMSVRTVFQSHEGISIEVTQIAGAIARTIIPFSLFLIIFSEDKDTV